MEEFSAVLNKTQAPFTFIPVKDGDFLADFATNQLARGDFLKVPILIGANSDEGSAFGQGRGPNGGPVNTDEDMRWAIRNAIPAQAKTTTGKSVEELVDEAMTLYPNDQSVGIPSLETWPHIIQPGEEIAVARGLQQRRTGAFVGDMYVQAPRASSCMSLTLAGSSSFYEGGPTPPGLSTACRRTPTAST